MGVKISDTAPTVGNHYNDDDRVIPGCEDFIHVAELHGLLGWDWDQMDVFYSPSQRRFFWYEQSGCSCNSPWEYGPDSRGEFMDGDRNAAIRAMRKYAREAYDDIDDQVLNREVDAVKKIARQYKAWT